MTVTPDASPSAEPKAAPDVVLEARDVTKEYPARSRRNTLEQALGGVTVTIRSGETLGVVGESGSGKTTLSRLLLGIERPTSGVVLFRGVPLRELDKNSTPPVQAIRGCGLSEPIQLVGSEDASSGI